MFITNLNKTYQIPQQQSRKKIYSCQQRDLVDQQNDKYSSEFKIIMSKIFHRLYPKGYNEKKRNLEESQIHERHEKKIVNQNYRQKAFFRQINIKYQKYQYQDMRIQGKRKCQTESNLHPQHKSFKITCKTPTIASMKNKQYQKNIIFQKNKSLPNQKFTYQDQSLQKFINTSYNNASSIKNSNKLIIGKSYKRQVNLPFVSSYADDQGYIKMVTLFKDREKGIKYNDNKMNFTKQNWSKKLVQKQKINKNKFRTQLENNNKKQVDQFQPWKIQHNQLITEDEYFNLKKNY